MRSKILIASTILLSLNSPCFSYYDTPLYATMSPPINLITPMNSAAPSSYGLGYNSSAALRERENDFYRQQALNAQNAVVGVARDAANTAYNQNNSRIRASHQQQGESQPVYNTNGSYVQDKPLYIFGR